MSSNTATNGNDLYALDKMLRAAGVWHGGVISRQDPQQRQDEIQKLYNEDGKIEYVLSKAGYDADGLQIADLTSITTFDPQSGIFDDKIIYWRKPGYVQDGSKEPQDHYVLQFRGIVDPEQSIDGLARVMPEQIWWNGSQIFQGPRYGGSQDPMRPEYQRLTARVLELSKRLKTVLKRKHVPIEEIGPLLATGNMMADAAGAVTGSPLQMRGLNASGGWNPLESYLHKSFADAMKSQDIVFNLPPFLPQDESLSLGFEDSAKPFMTTEDRLASVHGYYWNTYQPVTQMIDNVEDSATHLASGITYLVNSDKFYDGKSGHFVLRHVMSPDNPPEDAEVFEPFEMIRLEYKIEGNNCRLVDARFMEGAAGDMRNLQDRKNLIGALQLINKDLAEEQYPDYRSILMKTRLLDKMSQFGPPQKLSETGGEFKWFSINGRSLEKKFDVFGNDVGGGNMVVSYGLRENGEPSMVAILHDFPLIIGGPDSEYDGMVPDIMPWIEPLRKGAIVLSHDHFDHRSLEYLAKQKDEQGQGWLRGVRVLCRGDVADMVKKALQTLEIGKEDWPEFIDYDHPEVIQLPGEGQYAYCARDEDGKARIWAQVCENGTLHTARTDMHAFTGCYGDDFYKTTFVSDGDALDIHEHGWKFLEEGQLSLAHIPEVTLEKLTSSIQNFDELYVGWDEPTGIMGDGEAPTIEQFKQTMRDALDALPEDKVVFHHPFSTNVLEIQAFREVCNEPAHLRHQVAVGTNAQNRDTVMNIRGVDPFVDLREVEIPHDKLPQVAYDAALKAIDDYLEMRLNRQENKMDRGRAGLSSLDELLEKDIPYKVFRHIKENAEAEMSAGETKPRAIYEAFFSGNENSFEEIAIATGEAPAQYPRSMPSIVKSALEELQSTLKIQLESRGELLQSDTQYMMIRSLAKHGKMRFASKCAWNEKHLYDGIMREQEKVAVRATRGSKIGKGFRANPGRLAGLSTGATGSAEEDQSSLSRASRGEALTDYDEITRPTGYFIPSERMVRFITQTASMGSESETSQQAIVRDLVNNRGEIVFRAVKGGFEIHGAGAQLNHFTQHFRERGYNIRPSLGDANVLHVENAAFHIHGHRFYSNMLRKMQNPRYKARLVEAIHIPGITHFKRWQETVQKAGRKSSVTSPDDFAAMEEVFDEKGRSSLKVTDWLRPRYWAFRIKRKFGLQYGGVIEMFLHEIARNKGHARQDGFDVRTTPGTQYDQRTIWQAVNDAFKPVHGSASSQQKRMGPDLANIQAAGGKPMGMTAAALWRMKNQIGRRNPPAKPAEDYDVQPA